MTDTKWSEVLGVGIVGKLAGYELERIPFDRMKWEDWKSLHPETKVLSKDTGNRRPYGSDPYGDYYSSSQIMFSVQNEDDRLHPKEVVIGLHGNKGTYKAYKKEDVQQHNVINDSIDDKSILLVSPPKYPSAVRVFWRPEIQMPSKSEAEHSGSGSITGKQTLNFEFKNAKLIDTNTGSVWNFRGEAVKGPLEGKSLERVVHEPAFWFAWAAFHPETKIYS